MTPEFSRQCAYVLGSQYFNPPDDAEYRRRRNEFYSLRDEMIANDEANSADDLDAAVRPIWDRALKEQVEYDAKMAPLLAEGYERFSETLSPADVTAMLTPKGKVPVLRDDEDDVDEGEME